MKQETLETAIDIRNKLRGLDTALQGLTSRSNSELKEIIFDFRGISNGRDIEQRHVGEETIKDIYRYTILSLEVRKEELEQELEEL